MGPAVVPRAECDAGVDGGFAAVGPLLGVVGVEAGGAVAALGAAALVADDDREALGFGVQPAFAAQVQRHRRTAEDDRNDPGLAGQAAGQCGADLLPGVEE